MGHDDKQKNEKRHTWSAFANVAIVAVAAGATDAGSTRVVDRGATAESNRKLPVSLCNTQHADIKREQTNW